MSETEVMWGLEILDGRKEPLVTVIEYYKRDVIRWYEDIFGLGSWIKARRKGTVKIVKVKIVEVENADN